VKRGLPLDLFKIWFMNIFNLRTLWYQKG
jgi:hypothetical protein